MPVLCVESYPEDNWKVTYLAESRPLCRDHRVCIWYFLDHTSSYSRLHNDFPDILKHSVAAGHRMLPAITRPNSVVLSLDTVPRHSSLVTSFATVTGETNKQTNKQTNKNSNNNNNNKHKAKTKQKQKQQQQQQLEEQTLRWLSDDSHSSAKLVKKGH